MVAMAATEVATASAPHESPHAGGRPGAGAAAARTEQLFAEYGRTVQGLCHALLRDRAEAEDAAQQTFLSAHRALANGTEPREPAAWLATIARNECWARIRVRMREPLPVEALETATTTNDPLAEAIRRADLAALWHAIEELPRQQRDALVLREFGGLTYDELAVALAVTGPAVESLLFRARQRLRRRLRAAYAAISGASWIDALVRLVAGGGAPVAAKVAALGVGATAVGSSAVVVPHMFDNHRPSSGPLRAPAAVVQRSTPPSTPAPLPAPMVVDRVVTTQAVHRSRVAEAEQHRGSLPEAEHARGGEDGDGSGPGPASSPAASPAPAPAPVVQPLTVEPLDGHSGSDGGGHGGSGIDGGSDDGGTSSDGGNLASARSS
jgi:RNA polymerase sigma-70 factor, ECF subfamily